MDSLAGRCSHVQLVHQKTRVLLVGLLSLVTACGCGRGDNGANKPGAPKSKVLSMDGDGEQLARPGTGPNVHGDVAPDVTNPPPLFREITQQSGLQFSYSTGRDAAEYAILESLGGGVAAFDFDRDGWVDLMFAGGGRLDEKRVTAKPCGLFRNVTGEGKISFTEVTQSASALGDEFYNHGAFPADFDNDGFLDVAISGYGGIQLLRNQGDGTFQKYAVISTHATNSWSTSLTWGDFDGDGNLDLYSPNYVDWSWANHPDCTYSSEGIREVCPPKEFSGLDDVLLSSDGEGGFVARFADVGLVPGGKGLGAVAGDVDADGDLDLYVANDTTNNFLYLNDGTGRFEEQGILAGVSGDEAGVNTGSMGVLLQDVDGDGKPDIWVTNFERELFALYHNHGGHLFAYVSRTSGLGSLGGLYVGFGTVTLDYDFDGDHDIVVANGHVSYRPAQGTYKQPALLIENQGRGRFRRLLPGGYFDQQHTGRGVAQADLNNDGIPELIFSHTEEPASILANSNSPQRVATVRLVGRQSNRDAIGTAIHYRSGGRDFLYQANGGGSYLSHSDRRFWLFVPDDYNEVTVTVRWPSGVEQQFPFPSLGEMTTWTEPEAQDEWSPQRGG
jgi:hypothetical protein